MWLASDERPAGFLMRSVSVFSAEGVKASSLNFTGFDSGTLIRVSLHFLICRRSIAIARKPARELIIHYYYTVGLGLSALGSCVVRLWNTSIPLFEKRKE